MWCARTTPTRAARSRTPASATRASSTPWWRSASSRRVRHYLSHYADVGVGLLSLPAARRQPRRGGEVTASLRLLRLLVKYSCDFEALLRDGIRETPALAWCDVIPQLFARLRSLGGDVPAASKS
jgi:hypothetical protein